ncbi:GTPase [Gordonia sp. FQ]|uniref:GTPase n=1 Tax=Gordonia sp. FQ TaxID=3446634 RepID=UPI003F8323F5
MTERDAIHRVLDDGLHRLAALGPDLGAEATSIGEILWSPPRIVVVGRLKAGKSTLVNALIGAPVAETAALEATNVVTVYADGSPSRADVVGIDGRRYRVPVRHDRVAELPLAPPDIAYVDRRLPSAALRAATLIDTPGLSTTTTANDAATRRATVDGFAQTQGASVDADAAVFLFDAEPRADEADFLSSLPFTPLTMLGVLSRADAFGLGALGPRDPLGHAAEHARRLAGRLDTLVSGVIPVSGLMAQTSHTGMLTEAHAAALAQLAPLSRLDVLRTFDDDAFPSVLPVPTRIELLALLGEYGVLNGRTVASHGAAALNTWLAERSGIGELTRLLRTSITRYAVLHRAHRVLDRLDRLAFTHPSRESIRSLTAQLRSAPPLLAVTVLEDYQRMLRTDPRAAVTGELATVLTADTAAERVGLDPGAPAEAVAAQARHRLVAAQHRSLATSSAAEDAALVTLIRTYTQMT